MTQTTTLRTQAEELVRQSALEAAQKSHEKNYEKLHVRRDGTVSWFESINHSDDLIDDEAEHFCAIRSVITVGTGSYACNCDHCEDEGYESKADAIADAISDGAISDYEDQMVAAFTEIPVGYFDDEEEPAPEPQEVA